MSKNRLYSVRSATDNVNMVFDFVGENWRLWFKVMIYFLLPLSVLLGSSLVSFYGSGVDDVSTMGYVVPIVLFLIGCTVDTTLQLLLVSWHQSHDGSLGSCSVSALWPMMPRALAKCLGVIVLWTPVVVLALALVLIPVVGLLILFAILPVFLMCPIMLLEPGTSFGAMIGRAFSLGYKKWGALILTAVVMAVVAFFMNNSVTFPLGIYLSFESILQHSAPDTVLWSFITDVLRYVLYSAACFMIFVQIGVFVLAMTWHYGSVAAEAEDIGLESDIDNFANLN